MTEAEFKRSVNRDIRVFSDPDYGKPTDHNLDPRNEPDERDWSELDIAEKRARLTDLLHGELVTQAMDFSCELDFWRAKYARAHKSTLDEPMLSAGRWFVEKYRRIAAAYGIMHASLLMRKQGVPAELTAQILAKK